MAGATSVPAAEGAVTLRDGRSLAYAEWGDLTGTPVILFHGMPNSRLLCPDEEATRAACVRLITMDRPGYGQSDPKPNRTLLDWVDDFAEFSDLLELPPCPVVGWSSGGPYAMACGARLPGRVKMIGLAASDGPLDEVPGAWDELSPEVRGLIELLRRDRPSAVGAITKRCGWYADDPAYVPDSLRGQDNPDWVLFGQQPAIFEAWKHGRREGARQGVVGYVADWIAEFLPWGFSVADVGCPAHVWWGQADMLVSRAETEYLARTIPRSTLVTYPNEAHLVPFTHWAEILAPLL